MNTISNNKKGFTLVETLVALAMIMLALVPPMLIAYQGTATATFARDQVIASYLAQDAMDFIVAKTRENTFQCALASKNSGNPYNCSTGSNEHGSDWLAKLNNQCRDQDCIIYTTRTDADPYSGACAAGGCPALKYNESTGRYGYSSGNDTKFIRTVRFNHPTTNGANGGAAPGDDEALFTITVSWTTTGFKKDNSFSLQAAVYNIKPSES